MALSIYFWKYILFDLALKYGLIVGIPMSTNCAPRPADLFVFFYERHFMFSLSDIIQLYEMYKA